LILDAKVKNKCSISTNYQMKSSVLTSLTPSWTTATTATTATSSNMTIAVNGIFIARKNCF
jgi:hypothetical protein